MSIRKLSTSAIAVAFLAGGIFAAIPASAENISNTITSSDAAPPEGTFRVQIARDYMQWQEYRCPVGVTMTYFSLTGGPNVHIGTQYAFPQDKTHGSGFGADVINMSHTESSWYEVSYKCTTVPTTNVTVEKTVTSPAGPIGRIPRGTTQYLDCPLDHPVAKSATTKLIDGNPADSEAHWSLWYEPTPDRASIFIQNKNAWSATYKFTVVCGDPTSSPS